MRVWFILFYFLCDGKVVSQYPAPSKKKKLTVIDHHPRCTLYMSYIALVNLFNYQEKIFLSHPHPTTTSPPFPTYVEWNNRLVSISIVGACVLGPKAPITTPGVERGNHGPTSDIICLASSPPQPQMPRDLESMWALVTSESGSSAVSVVRSIVIIIIIIIIIIICIWLVWKRGGGCMKLRLERLKILFTLE